MQAIVGLSQVILVERHGCHEDVISAAAEASLRAYLSLAQPAASWDEWLAGRFTKSVRTVKSPAHLERARTWAATEGLGSGSATGKSQAVALAPAELDALPKFIRSARVSDLERPRGTDWLPRESAPVELLVLASLSTGKAAAQAAHALWMAYLSPTLLVLDQTSWAESGHVFRLRFVDAQTLASAEGLAVVDSGLTEVAPGTLTAKAIAH